MTRGLTKRTMVAALCATLVSLTLAVPVQAATSDPLFVFVPPPPVPPLAPPPTGYFEGPCGIGVDSSGRFYVSDYYHDAVDVFSPPAAPFNSPPSYLGQLASQEPLDGPCGLALDVADHLYVDDFHRGVVSYGALGSFGTGTPVVGAGETHPTGIAADPTTGYVYVDERTYVGVYEASGAPLEEGGEPVRIGESTLGDGYGLALSRYSSTTGYLYVPDASTKTVKVYDPASSKTTPVATIHGPAAGFVSLRDSAVAVNWSTGIVYVVDDLQPSLTEEPKAIVYAFSPSGSYLGALKYEIYDALPPGLAVDNSGLPSQGRVYVTSGNSDQAGVYAYAPGSQTGAALPPAVGLTVRTSGTGGGTIAGSLGGIECSGSCEAQIRSGAEVTLSATPDPGSAFSGWSGGGCQGTGSCTVRMDEAHSLSAGFQPLSVPAAPTAPAASATPSPPPGASIPRRHRHHRCVRRRHLHRPRPGSGRKGCRRAAGARLGLEPTG